MGRRFFGAVGRSFPPRRSESGGVCRSDVPLNAILWRAVGILARYG